MGLTGNRTGLPLFKELHIYIYMYIYIYIDIYTEIIVRSPFKTGRFFSAQVGFRAEGRKLRVEGRRF